MFWYLLKITIPPQMLNMYVFILAQIAVTKYHTLGGLNNKYLFFTVLEAGSSKIKVSADVARSES